MSEIEINIPAEGTVPIEGEESIQVEANGRIHTITTQAIRKGLALADDTYWWLVTKLTRHFKYTPYMTRGHIQMSLGPATPPRVWEGPLARMQEEGRMICQTTISNFRTKRVYHLPDMPWPPITIARLDQLEKQAWLKGYEAAKAGQEVPKDVLEGIKDKPDELDENGDGPLAPGEDA